MQLWSWKETNMKHEKTVWDIGGNKWNTPREVKTSYKNKIDRVWRMLRVRVCALVNM
jgi:hypothetical protein